MPPRLASQAFFQAGSAVCHTGFWFSHIPIQNSETFVRCLPLSLGFRTPLSGNLLQLPIKREEMGTGLCIGRESSRLPVTIVCAALKDTSRTPTWICFLRHWHIQWFASMCDVQVRQPRCSPPPTSRTPSSRPQPPPLQPPLARSPTRKRPSSASTDRVLWNATIAIGTGFMNGNEASVVC